MESVAQWKPAELLTQLPPPVVMSIAQVLSGRELALWGSLARLFLGLLIITGVTGTGDRVPHPVWTKVISSAQLFMVLSDYSKEQWCKVRAAVHFVSYIFIQYFPHLIAFRLEINFILKSLCYCCFLIFLFFFPFLSCLFFRNTFFSVQTLSCSI